MPRDTMRRGLALFDFDRTLVARDSFRLFGNMLAENVWRRAHLLGLALAYKAGGLTNGGYKARVLQNVWLPKSEDERVMHLRPFYDALRRRERVAVVHRLHRHLERGDLVAILSASPHFYLAPFVEKTWSGDIDVHGSEVRVSGREVVVDALYGEKKRTRAQQLIQQHEPEAVWAYTDHRSDLPFLALADHPRLVNPSRALCRAADERGLSYEVIEPST